MKDDRFLARVIGMSLAVSAFGAWFLLALGREWHAASFLLGAAISLGMFVSSGAIVKRNLAPGMPDRKWAAIVVAVPRYGLAGLIIWWFVDWPHARMGAFIAGVAVTQIVLVLKAVGRTMAPDREPFRWGQAIKNLTRMR